MTNDFVVNLQEYYIGVEYDLECFSQAMNSKQSELWYNAMKEEMNSMKSNEVWDFVNFLSGVKTILMGY